MLNTFIIAEAGVNHNGDYEIAKRLIDEAKLSGADAVKFQSFKTENVISINSPKADYQKITTGEDESQFDMVKKLELSSEKQKLLYNYCNEKRITFLSSPFDLESIDLLNDLGLEIFKIPSGEITNLPYLKKIGGLKKKIFLSTGMSYLGEIEQSLNILEKYGTKHDDIIVLHCNTEYPTPYIDVNLKAMLTIKEAFKIKVGYSDHTSGIEISLAAVALGAEIIEKHFTLNRNMQGPDHKASLEPKELKQLVESIRNIETALGNGIKKLSPSEIKNINIARKSIVALTSIKKGDILTENNITVKRPGNGISPMRWEEILGQVAKENYNKDELIKL